MGTQPYTRSPKTPETSGSSATETLTADQVAALQKWPDMRSWQHRAHHPRYLKLDRTLGVQA